MEEVIKSPRTISFFYRRNERGDIVTDLKPYKTISFLTDCNSCPHCVVPDVAEIFDQMTEEDKLEAKAVCITNTDSLTAIIGWDFVYVMEAVLLK